MKPTKLDEDIFELRNKINNRFSNNFQETINKVKNKIKRLKTKQIYEKASQEFYSKLS